ncbi:MAG: class I SAM-dependent methyltransferase [Clostridia bacterium]
MIKKEKSCEYSEMASFYDVLYCGKNYQNEVQFINNFINDKVKTLIDLGCGTGEHLKELSKLNSKINLTGLDLNVEMLEVAKNKNKGNFFQGDILDFISNKKFDFAISMFAVLNHLKSYKQFKKALCNTKELLKENGVFIFDLHNPLKNGCKVDEINKIKRFMQWKINKIFGIEKTNITYEINGKTYKAKHTFKIYKINKLKKIIEKKGFKILGIYENYTLNYATEKSKNLQFVLQKNC